MNGIDLFQPPVHEKVLLVHESESILQILRKQLRRFPSVQTLLEAKSGGQAYSLFASSKPSLVIASINLPDISGFDLLRCLKQASPNCVVCLLSTGNDRFIRQTATALGANAVCSAGGDQTELASVMQSLLNRSNQSKTPPAGGS